MILSDQQRMDTVGTYGSTICRTPNIDSIAAGGVRFDNAFTPSAICSPARASLFTGVYPHKHGVMRNYDCLNGDVRGLTDYLIPAGYTCGYAGKWHVDDEKGPTDFGFVGKDFIGYAFPGSRVLDGLQFDLPPKNTPNYYEEYVKERGFEGISVTNRFVGNNPTNQEQEMFALHDGPVESCIEYFVAEEAIRTIDEVSGGEEPFFMWANFWGPHSPSLVPEPYYSMYDPAEIPEHPSYCETFENKPYGHRLVEKLWGLGDYGWKGFQEITARYLGHCTLIDDMVGRIVAHLKARGVLEDTVLIYATDHGDCMGAHRLIEKGTFMYDEIYRIPLIVAHPSCESPGTANSDFVYLHELMNSILDMAGVESPAHLDGESLLPQMLGHDYSNGRTEVFCTFESHFFEANQRMIRTADHQFTFNAGDRGELYDLRADPYQLTNEYENPVYDKVRRDLIARMDAHMKRLRDPQHAWFSRIIGAY